MLRCEGCYVIRAPFGVNAGRGTDDGGGRRPRPRVSLEKKAAAAARGRHNEEKGEGRLRPSGRASDELRKIAIEKGVAKHAEGSCLVRFGDTHVLCTASVDGRVPSWLRDSGKGWVTAEYGMLPRATATRTDREAARGRQSGRTQEIQRLIGRSLRAVIDLAAMPEIQIKIDCDVIQADGGTRTASITGAYVALHQACQHLLTIGAITKIPLRDEVAAVSCGLYKGAAVLDLDYAEDSEAELDANFVLTGSGEIVEIQMTAEAAPFPESRLMEILALARKGIGDLTARQREVLGISPSGSQRAGT